MEKVPLLVKFLVHLIQSIFEENKIEHPLFLSQGTFELLSPTTTKGQRLDPHYTNQFIEFSACHQERNIQNPVIGNARVN